MTHPLANSATSASPSEEVTLSLEKSLAFARLSGDFNPMHVDPVAARRTQYGSTVVHGMHLLLTAIDAAVRRGLVHTGDIDAMSVTFSNPALTGLTVRFVFKNEAALGKLRITGEHEGRLLFTANLSLGNAADGLVCPPDAGPEVTGAAVDRAMPDDGQEQQLSGSVPWRLSRSLFTTEFPTLASQPGGFALGADLLASTRIVGMECPGLHSIFSALKLKRIVGSSDMAPARMLWRVTKLDARFRLARMTVTGGRFVGTIDAFFRPPPVLQAPLSSLLHVVTPNAYDGQQALVVGGSRGLGELTAKLLLAGGAQVTITYARGRADAESVCEEARALGRACTAVQLDMRPGSAMMAVPEALRGAFSHLYFFASPRITKTTPGQWRQDVFDEFAAFYLRGFADLLSDLVSAQPGSPPMKVLYPSTAFLDTHEKGFAEYCAAKAAGESLCAHLATHHGVLMSCPRLPRMRTDQTSGLMASETDDAVMVMKRALDGIRD